jgi:hypothetical protein
VYLPMLSKKTISLLLAVLGVLSFAASAKAQFSSQSMLMGEQVKQTLNLGLRKTEFQKAELLAQANRRQTICDNNNNIDTLLYFSTNNQKSVRIFRLKNEPKKLLMNIYDSKNKADLASNALAAQVPKNVPVTYSARVSDRIYYAIVSMNSKSQIQGSLVATDQNGQRRLWTEPAAGEVTLKLNVSQ